MVWTRSLPAIYAAALIGCSGDNGPSDPGNDQNTGSTVTVANNAFDPASLDVPLNSTVTWVWNSGGVEHNVTFQAGPNSPTQGSGSFPRTFPSAGSFPYVCTIHQALGMSGVVNVAAGTSGTGGGGSGGGGTGDGDDGGGGGGYP
ncbi:MAG TPA: plastocyanin/azurin family copper-binding protein [Gemmatimonadales bacterium]|nr:plastocyanin/azurin family copper-binding protein [Gemmatimonadales bacterium]